LNSVVNKVNLRRVKLDHPFIYLTPVVSVKTASKSTRSNFIKLAAVMNGPDPACQNSLKLDKARSISLGWSVVDASLIVGANYEFGGIFPLRGFSNSEKHKIYHSGAYTVGISLGADSTFTLGIWCGTVPSVGLSKNWGVTVGGAYGVGATTTIWFDGSFSRFWRNVIKGKGKRVKFSGMSFAAPQVGFSVEAEVTAACSNYQWPGGTFGKLSGECK